LIVVAPKAKGNGRSTARVVENLDMYRTLAELAGLAPPNDLEGRSLVPLLTDPATPWHHPAYSVWSEDGETFHGVAVRNERWRYAEFGPEGANGALLFDEQSDPSELKNLADDPKRADVRRTLSALVREYARQLATR
jgi:iduronate 2-sulfatase